MTGRLLAAVVLLTGLATACVPKGVEVQPEPAWKQREGRKNIRLDLAAQMLEFKRHQEAQRLIAMVREDAGKRPVPEADLLQGRAYAIEGMVDEAEQLLVSAAAGLPRDARPYRELGLLYAEADRPDEAIAAYERAVELDPSHAASWNNLGFLRFSQGDAVAAVDALEEAVARDGSEARYRQNLAFALLRTGRVDRARRLFESVGGRAHAWYNLGVAWEATDDATAALDAYRKALEADPSYEPAQEALARLESP